MVLACQARCCVAYLALTFFACIPEARAQWAPVFAAGLPAQYGIPAGVSATDQVEVQVRQQVQQLEIGSPVSAASSTNQSPGDRATRTQVGSTFDGTRSPLPSITKDDPAVRTLYSIQSAQSITSPVQDSIIDATSRSMWSADSILYKLDHHGVCSLNRQGAALRSCP